MPKKSPNQCLHVQPCPLQASFHIASGGHSVGCICSYHSHIKASQGSTCSKISLKCPHDLEGPETPDPSPLPGPPFLPAALNCSLSPRLSSGNILLLSPHFTQQLRLSLGKPSSRKPSSASQAGFNVPLQTH